MKNEKTLTPIVVGVVIALIGILLGLYFAENAREQFSATGKNAAEKNLGPAEKNLVLPEKNLKPAEENLGLPDLEELPPLAPLDPIVTDEGLQQQPEPASAKAGNDAGDAEADNTVAPYAADEVDDFEEVVPEIEEQAAKEQPADTIQP